MQARGRQGTSGGALPWGRAGSGARWRSAPVQTSGRVSGARPVYSVLGFVFVFLSGVCSVLVLAPRRTIGRGDESGAPFAGVGRWSGSPEGSDRARSLRGGRDGACGEEGGVVLGPREGWSPRGGMSRRVRAEGRIAGDGLGGGGGGRTLKAASDRGEGGALSSA